jgi:cell division protein FtsB
MPLAIEITLNILWIPLLCLISAIAGFLLRSVLIGKLKKQVWDLEKVGVQRDAEILSLEKENGILQEQLKNNNQVPVIPMTTKENPDKLPDGTSRKKLLEKTSTQQHP